MSRKLDNIHWNAGYNAYHFNVPRNLNPYSDELADIWEDGWDCADSDADDEVFEDLMGAIPFEECSALVSVMSPNSDMSRVVEKLAAFPVRYKFEDGRHRWVYDGKCDGNTSYELERIIRACISLYEDDKDGFRKEIIP